jgi:hypothetical protein
MALLAACICGCNGEQRVEIIPPRDVSEALARVNAHMHTESVALYCTGLVTIRFRDSNQAQRRFFAQPMTLIYRPERCLYMNIKSSLAGSLARIGSNDERYWLCVDDADFRRMWWGWWRDTAQTDADDIPVPPDDLFDALMLRRLPPVSIGGASPYVRIEDEDHRLVYVRMDENRNTLGVREIVLDPVRPYLPRGIVDRSADGEILMRATLADWRRVAGSRVWTARRYVIEWPFRDAELRIDIETAKFRPDQPPFCDFPRDWNGPQQQLGGVAQTGASSTQTDVP